MHGPSIARISDPQSIEPERAPSSAMRWLKGLICVGLLLVSALLYGRMVHENFDFVQFDDHLYVFRNSDITRGLSWQGVLWAFNPNTIVAANWHPLTVISHMADCTMFGVEPRYHHMVSAIWHSLNTVLLFLVLGRMTGAIWTSALVAALFCWHPLHVESVAWISERKDVLSAFFWLAGMWLYVSYVQRPSAMRYALVAIALLLGLLSKPMVVTLPCVLLLLDFWPLRRIEDDSLRSKEFWRQVGRLALEKAPLFLIVLLLSAVTMYAQSAQHAVASLSAVPLTARIVNVLMSYNAYIAKTIWPQTLAIPYPISSRPLTLMQALLGGVGLMLVTGIVILLRRRVPYWFVGWLWYIGTMVPVIGLVQVGSQSMADRYSYIPLIGIFIGIAFSLRDLAQWRPAFRPVLAAGGAAWLVVLALLTYRQVGYWKDSLALFSHTIEATKRNPSGYGGRATAYMLIGEDDKALVDLNDALKIDYRNGMARCNRGILFRTRRQYERAIKDFEMAATKGDYEPARMYAQCGQTYLVMDKVDKAREYFSKALKLDPDEVDSSSQLLGLDLKEGHTADAIKRIKRVLAKRKLSYFEVLLSRIYSTNPEAKYRNGAEALRLAQDACRQTQESNALALDTLAAAYAELGQFDKAREYARKARQRAVFDHEDEFVREIDAHYELYLGDRTLRDDMRDFNFDRT